MNTKYLRLAALAAAIQLGGILPAAAVTAPEGDGAMATKLVTALEQADYAAFVEDGDAMFKGLNESQFQAVAAQVGPRLKAGYEIAYLGELKQRGYQVTLWKLSFKDGGDDALASLSMKDGKVGGFWLR